MQVLRLAFKEDIPFGIFSNTLNYLSTIYRFLLLAYNEQTKKENDNIESLCHIKWDNSEDLLVEGVSKGSIILDLADSIGADKALSKFVEWILTVIDPKSRKKKDLDIKDLEQEIEHRRELGKIEIARAGVALVKEALEMHDGLILRGFPDSEAKKAFRITVQCLGSLRQIQESNNAISRIELLEK